MTAASHFISMQNRQLLSICYYRFDNIFLITNPLNTMHELFSMLVFDRGKGALMVFLELLA